MEVLGNHFSDKHDCMVVLVFTVKTYSRLGQHLSIYQWVIHLT